MLASQVDAYLLHSSGQEGMTIQKIRNDATVLQVLDTFLHAIEDAFHTFLIDEYLHPVNNGEELRFDNFKHNAHIHTVRVTGIGMASENTSSCFEFAKVGLKVHAYHLHTQSTTSSDFLASKNARAKIINLPNQCLDGVWESLKFDEKQNIHPEQILNETVRTVALLYQADKLPGVMNINRLILFHGPPGCGKSTLCRTFRGGKLFEINTQDLLSKFYSESGKLVSEMFDKILNMANDSRELVCVLIDEIESIAASRRASTKNGECADTVRTTNQLLTALDCIRSKPNIVVFCTSNLLETIDTAFLDRVYDAVSMPSPCASAVYTILSNILNTLIDAEAITLPKIEPPLKRLSSLDEVIQTARALSTRLLSDWHELRTITTGHEDLVRKRWRKKARDQKRVVLEEAWGVDLSESHRPDLILFINSATQESSNLLDAYKWPYLNLEDLLQPRVLPIFLESRATHHPYEFCHADLDACALGLSAGKIETGNLKGSMLFDDSENAQSYGQVVQESDDSDPANDHSGYRFKLGEGLLILETQQRLCQFLLACAKSIMHDVAPESTETISPDPEVQPSSAHEHTSTSLAANTLDAPYLTPAELDISRLKSLISAKRSSIADHIWLLREDPSYFADCVNEWKDHQPEMLLDSQGNKHPIHKVGLTKPFWNRVLRKMITDSYLSLSLWDSTYSEVCKLDELLQQYPKPPPLQPLPAELAFATKKVRHLLEMSATNSIALLKSHVPPSPPMLKYWHREGTSTADHHSSKFRMIQNPRSENDPALDRLFCVYTTLWDEKQVSLVGLHTLVGELERLTYADTKAKDLQSALVVDNIGDLGLISECLHQLSLYYPWSRSIEHEMARNRQQLAEEFYTKAADWENFRKMSWQGVDLAELGSPGDGRFSYPISNRRTKTNASALYKAEHQLDAFWHEIDTHFASQPSTLPDKMMRLLLAGDRSLHRTTEWQEPVKAEVKTNGKLNGRANGKTSNKGKGKFNSISAINAKDKQTEKTTPPVQQSYESSDEQLSTTYLQLGRHKRHASLQDSPSKTSPTKSKVTQSPSNDASTASSTPALTVDKRAKKTFSTLFFVPSTHDTPADTTWTDFIHAMLSCNFGVEKLYGSIWHFTPPAEPAEKKAGQGESKQSIQFHAPWNEDKIRYYVARLMGRRLKRAYGWNTDTFVVVKE
ncbi:hypothetical protein E4T42_07198 [Aureobasidium subglaciale]|nr:hypothetical protein E4T42_07198 [Aureobasidium subglaciale]